MMAATDIALEGLTRQLEKAEDPEFLLDAADKLLHRMGYAPASARNPAGQIVNQTTNVQNNITVSSSDLAAARDLLSSRIAGRIESDLSPEDINLLPLVSNASA